MVPLTATAANSAQERYASDPPAARITTAGVSTMPAMHSIASCSPKAKLSTVGGDSSAW